MLLEKFQTRERLAVLEYWPYWFQQIVRAHRRSYSLKVHAQIEHGDVIVGWQHTSSALELWNAEHVVVLLGDVQPSQEEWRARASTDEFSEPQPIWLSELQAAGLMLVAHASCECSRLSGSLRPMNRATYEALGWMGRKSENRFAW